MNKAMFKNIYPRQVWTNENYKPVVVQNQDERFGGFLFPFIAGAAVTAPLWYVAGNNKAQQQYYQNQPYPVYYPYQNAPQGVPSYYPYPPYR